MTALLLAPIFVVLFCPPAFPAWDLLTRQMPMASSITLSPMRPAIDGAAVGNSKLARDGIFLGGRLAALRFRF